MVIKLKLLLLLLNVNKLFVYCSIIFSVLLRFLNKGVMWGYYLIISHPYRKGRELLVDIGPSFFLPRSMLLGNKSLG